MTHSSYFDSEKNLNIVHTAKPSSTFKFRSIDGRSTNDFVYCENQ